MPCAGNCPQILFAMSFMEAGMADGTAFTQVEFARLVAVFGLVEDLSLLCGPVKREPTAYRTPRARDDFPEPDTPAIPTSRFRGMSRSIFFRLCTRAPRISIWSGIVSNSLTYSLKPRRWRRGFGIHEISICIRCTFLRSTGSGRFGSSRPPDRRCGEAPARWR